MLRLEAYPYCHRVICGRNVAFGPAPTVGPQTDKSGSESSHCNCGRKVETTIMLWVANYLSIQGQTKLSFVVSRVRPTWYGQSLPVVERTSGGYPGFTVVYVRLRATGAADSQSTSE